MRFVLDVHCHTVASGHAYSTVSENAAHAASIGLTHIGIADHGPAMPGGTHLYTFTNQWILPDYIHGVRVLKGAEVNIIDNDGKLDLPGKLLRRMDFSIASIHRGVWPPTDKDTHTSTLIKAMENPVVSIIGHPGDIHFEIDIEAVVAAATRTGTIIEINNQTLNPQSVRYNGDDVQRLIIAMCKAYKAPVIVSSDAHFSTQVGKMDKAKALVEAAGLPEYQVMNTSAELFLETIQKKRGN